MSNDNTVASATEVAPYAGSVLYLIYGVDGDGATSHEIDNGAMATFWGGQHFDLDGRHYYTGFAYATPNKYGNDEAETFLIRASGCRLAKPRSC
ncbi:hypothetical protein NDY24_07920 [Xanthomonas hortorum pv. pelargonii]|nr:hypothetical protein NDY24_07920 [Xanthomonas hortorum pv. pelargonii]